MSNPDDLDRLLDILHPEPTRYTFGPVDAYRSHSHYGWEVNVGRRFQVRSRRATTPMWPQIQRGADEHCNRAVVAILWPLGAVTVWWEPRWRTEMCDECVAEWTGAS